MHASDQVKMPTGVLVLDIFKHGERIGRWRRKYLLERWDGKNLIVNGAKTQLAHLLGGDTTGRPVTKIGFGTNGAAPNVSNTALTGAFVKNTGTATYPTSTQVQFPFTLLTSEANGLSIIEFGLLSTDNTLFSRRVRGSAIVKDNTISFSGTWTISF